MPSNVMRFERLYYLSLVVNLIQIVMTYGEQVAFAVRVGLGHPFIIATHIVTFAVYIVLIRQAARGRKPWARLVLLVFFVFALLATAIQFGPMLALSATEALLSVIYLVLQGAGLFFVFTGDARGWFARPAAA